MDVTESLDPHLFDGLSVYQDVVLAGRTVLRGVRDCHERWAILEPHLPHAGAILDIGSNFGWFGLKICESRPECVVASVEADSRSALIQRQVLASQNHRRMVLLTAKANRRLVQRFAAHGQHFAAALCLSILHWMPDHREFLAALGKITDRILIEYPHSAEVDAGSARIRAEIGDIGPYLSGIFPGRPVICIGECATHLDRQLRRPIWLVEPSMHVASPRSPNARGLLNFAALVKNGLSWPPQSWWSQSISVAETSYGFSGLASRQLRRLITMVPEHELYGPRGRWRRRVRQLARSWSRSAGAFTKTNPKRQQGLLTPRAQ